MSIPQHCVDDTAAVMGRMESCIDEAVCLSGQLSGELIKAQTEGRLHPMFMHSEIFARLPSLFAALMAARGAAVDVHQGMNRIAQKLGLEKSALIGPPTEKTWPPPVVGVAASSAVNADPVTANA